MTTERELAADITLTGLELRLAPTAVLEEYAANLYRRVHADAAEYGIVLNPDDLIYTFSVRTIIVVPDAPPATEPIDLPPTTPISAPRPSVLRLVAADLDGLSGDTLTWRDDVEGRDVTVAVRDLGRCATCGHRIVGGAFVEEVGDGSGYRHEECLSPPSSSRWPGGAVVTEVEGQAQDA
jgi:hypothetical protein